MTILINKDGKQLGPFSLDEACGLVRAGSLSPDDWAWADGATDWIPLKNVPGFTIAAKPAPPSAAAVAVPAAAATPSPTGALPAEEELWSGHPSQILNLGIYVFWGALFVVAAGAAFLLVSNVDNPWLWIGVIVIGVGVIALVNVAVAYMHLRVINYVVTTQRVRVISGMFSKEIQEIELFRVKDTMANQSFLLRMFGLGTITILSGDKTLPRLVLSGVPNAIELRERLRTEVMALRQRFGVREVDVM